MLPLGQNRSAWVRTESAVPHLELTMEAEVMTARHPVIQSPQVGET